MDLLFRSRRKTERPARRFRFSVAVFAFLGLVVAGGLAVLAPAIAQYGAGIGKDPRGAAFGKQDPSSFLSADGGGFETGGRVQIVILTADGGSQERWADVSDRGTFEVPAFAPGGPAAGDLIAYFRFYPDKLSPPVEAGITFRSRTLTVSAKGSGAGRAAAADLFLGGEKPAAGTVADWSGVYAIDGAPMSKDLAGGNGRACVRLSATDTESGPVRTFCIARKATEAGGFQQAQLLDYIMKWIKPIACGPFGVPLSICNDAHLAFLSASEINNYVRAFMMMANQFTTVMLEQARDFGFMLDAKQQLETQRWYQEKSAETHKDYTPSRLMCQFGSFSEGLNSSERKVELNALAVNRYLTDREAATAFKAAGDISRGTGAPEGYVQDRQTRLEQFKGIYCHPDYNQSNGLALLCAATQPTRVDRDINFSRTIESSLSVNADFSDGVTTTDETDILSLSKYLYSHDLFKFPDRSVVYDPNRGETLVGIRDVQRMRSLTALRGVARNSFSHIVAMRTPGSGLGGGFMRTMLTGMGVPAADVNGLLGVNPSYMAQMEVLTKKMFQNPNFYTGLYDKPANVDRVGAVLQAVQLMHDRERFEAGLRREMLVSVMLEARLRELQDVTERRIQSETQNLTNRTVAPAGP